MIKKLLILSLICVSCSSPTCYVSPEIDLPECWQTSQLPHEEMQVDFVWWEALDDPLLSELIKEAFYNNLDLSFAHYRILEARAMQKGAESLNYPHIDASLAYASANYPADLLKSLGIEPHLGKSHHQLFELGFDAEWEIDLFGKNALEREAAQATTESKIEEFNHLWVTLSAEVARNYIELRLLQHHRELTEQEISGQKESLKLTSDLAGGGFLSYIDQMQANEQLSLLRAKIPDYQVAIDKAINRLSLLVGKLPGELQCLKEMRDFPKIPCHLPIAVPSELLRRRPDIRKAERELAAACALTQSAAKDLFPRLSLKGFAGEIFSLCKGNFVSLVNPNLLFPLFNSSLIQKDIAINQMKAQQAAVNYKKTVILALEETENAISSFTTEEKKERFLSEAKRASQESLRLTQDLYHHGLKDYLSVLTARKQLSGIKEAFLSSKSASLMHYIALYKALGGSFNPGF